MKKYIDTVRSKIISNEIISISNIFDPIPPRDQIREKLSQYPINILDRTFRIIKVEDLKDYKIFIQIPEEKTEFDFFVWRALFKNDDLMGLKIPSHDDLGKMYLDLKKKHDIINEYLIDATIKFIRDRWPINTVLSRYFTELPQNLISDIKKFLLTLKWIAIQEDANYPPPYLGSMYSLSVYAILEITGDLSALRKIIRFRGW